MANTATTVPHVCMYVCVCVRARACVCVGGQARDADACIQPHRERARGVGAGPPAHLIIRGQRQGSLSYDTILLKLIAEGHGHCSSAWL